MILFLKLSVKLKVFPNCLTLVLVSVGLNYRPRTYVRREVMFSQVCVCSGGVPGPGQGRRGGFQVQVGGSQVQVQGGSQVQVQVGGGIPGPGRGDPRSRFRWGGPRSRGVPSLRSRGGIQSQIWGGYPVSVKGKIFDTRFGLIHVQTGKKFFVEGPPPPQ